MIQAVMVINTQGKPRLAKFYEFQPVEKQQELIRMVYGVLSSRAENVINFLDVESIFGPLHTVLDEIIFGGQVLETSSTEVLKLVEEISKLETASNTISLVPKSVSSWRSR